MRKGISLCASSNSAVRRSRFRLRSIPKLDLSDGRKGSVCRQTESESGMVVFPDALETATSPWYSPGLSIPWDENIDPENCAMLRVDFYRFRRVARMSFSHPFFFQRDQGVGIKTGP